MDYQPAKFKGQEFGLALYTRTLQTIVYFKGFIISCKRRPEVGMTELVWWPYRMIQETRTIFIFLLQGVHLKVASWSNEAVGMLAVTAASQVSG